MSGVRLTLKQNPDEQVLADALSADVITGRSLREIESMPLTAAGEMKVGDWFSVRGDDALGEDCVLIEGDLGSFDRVAGRQGSGQLRVDGDVGEALGCGMSGGSVVVHGNAGNRVAAPLPGKRSGMRGGRLEIFGHVGNELASRMRRGEVLVSGSAGDFMAAHMIAGTVLVAGEVGDQLAFGMRRGSLLLADDWYAARIGRIAKDSSSMLLESRERSNLRFSWPVPARSLWTRLFQAPESAQAKRLFQRFADEPSCVRRGDRAVRGQGEILWPGKTTGV